jgi:hypothetical protein
MKRRALTLARRFSHHSDELAIIKALMADVLLAQRAGQGMLPNIQSAEFKVSSQFGEDGIIQYLIRQAGIPRDRQTFVEFGVGSYDEANTRFLLTHDNWRGLIMDGDPEHMAAVRESSLYWRHDLTAISAFIDSENINGLIRDAGFSGEIGLLSVDIDGIDYWVWEAVDVVNPIIVVAEYNSVFGSKHAVTIPLDQKFQRARAHYSNLYWGVSLKALELLARRKGFALVGSNSAGNNAFFVRRDRLNGQRELTAEEAYVDARFRESRNKRGELTFLSGRDRLREIEHLSIYDVENQRTVAIRELA